MRAKMMVAALLGAVAMTPASAPGQIWIGQIAGEMASQAAAAARERACRAGVPASDKRIADATSAAATLMQGYFALSAKAKAGDFKRVFAMKVPDVSWKGPDGVVPIAALGALLDTPVPTLAPVNFVVGGDGMTARGVWRASYADGTRPGEFYAVDFTGGSGSIWSSGWRIWHMTLVPGDQAPAAPAAYCHYDKDQAW
ncbi:hypothetical protein QH494_22975 [Sphingomonas sp. AR_OL41]|uniref:hypothetical protein n=1 Tax=Sphingomonas sp. AR_OL41 TaxID=3042729 RepID=UPI0024810334|nr:hypothetical protein [Sphingomonas sp. AR_OL41]MDH7975057.1 hypothetical protein [Sphingomonas sp. AR_OL41]